MKRMCVLALAAAIAAQVACGCVWADEPAIPYPRALDAAAIVQDRLDSILDRSLILGNGDINGLLYSDRGALVLRLTKNDVWDARLDAKLNPPIPTMKRIKELSASGRIGGGGRAWILPAGSKWRGPDSYHAHPYPCPRACGVVRIGAASGKPTWRCIRRQGRTNAFERRGGVTVMSIEGKAGASNGYRLSPLALTTDDCRRLRVKISGTPNAKFFIDVMGPGGKPIFSSKWIVTPTAAEERTFDLPAGNEIGGLILYTWTTDGKRAENRFSEVAFEGSKGKRAIDLTVTPPARCSGRLDLRRAAAMVRGADGGPPSAQVRALTDRNVFLIETGADVRLEGVKSAGIPAFSSGRRDGVSWLTQKIPADEDWPGMSFAVALAGEDGAKCKAVAIVTSLEAKDPLAAAVALARSALKAGADNLIESHEGHWRRFWSASGVDLEDAFLRDAWYRNLYFLRCVTKPGVVAPGLFASLIHDRPAWHGDYHTNYNIQQTFWAAYVTNHPELADPYDRLVREYLPRARWLARKVFDCGGAYYPHVLFAYEPPDPAKCKAPYGRQYIHHVWGFSLGVNGFTAQPLWWHYKYAPDPALLEKTVYPVVRDTAVFYADLMDTCQRSASGKVRLGPSVSPEHWGWTKGFARNYDGAFDIAMIRYTLSAAVEAAAALGRDEKLVARWQKALARLPDYPTTRGAEPVVVDMAGAPPTTYNIAVPAVPVFPGDVVTWFSPEDEKKLFTRTVQSCRWNGNNSMVILAVARARLSMPGTGDWLAAEIKARLRPNKTITLNRLGAGFNNYGHYTEQFATSMAVSELLLQSVGDIIRVFPAWGGDKDASFRDLRAQGGFLVSARQAGGKVVSLEIVSTAGGRLHLLSPWPGIRLRLEGRPPAVLKPDSRGLVSIDTTPGQRLVFAPALF